ncbi:hypothetical protein CPB85DRAFT_1448799 [Mucidula mucida]|nr:hypothetical protein CPB85DRAFT_1448799 [Mucidula mucida]
MSSPATSSDSEGHMEFLFVPPNGHARYAPSDYPLVCQSSPFPLNEIPFYLAELGIIPGWQPPRLWCGWHLGEEALFERVERQYPSRIHYTKSSNRLMKTATVADALPEIICQEFQISAEFHHLIRAVDGAYSNGRVDTVLSIGCNYKPREADYIDRIKRELFNGVDPEWVLCPMRWCWTPDKRQTVIAATHAAVPEVQRLALLFCCYT